MKTQIGILFLLLATKVHCEDICHYPGRCEGGVELGVISTKDYFSCQTQCQGVQDCFHFTFHQGNGLCELFQSRNTIDQDSCSGLFCDIYYLYSTYKRVNNHFDI